ncbi:MAG: LemA family protein [Acidobacteria bacterium]|nr:MAG: LemA family protein [Acidobacteriota bacterium]REK11122.1 MAG: LemA family protein [Acidobacteriota bacterium]
MKVGTVLMVILVLALLLVGGAAWSTHNRLVGLDEGVSSAWAQVENAYQRRADLIPNLVATVQGAADFERETLESVVRARAQATQTTFEGPPDAEQLARFQEAQGELGSALARLLVVVERYPELRATEAFRDLQAQLEGTENRIAVERRRFNEAAQELNSAVRRFPASIFAGWFGFERRPYFEADEGSEEPPQVEFGG